MPRPACQSPKTGAVDDIAGEVAQLRARGVEIQDLPDLNTIDGIADIGFALAAWFTDPTTTHSASCDSNKGTAVR